MNREWISKLLSSRAGGAVILVILALGFLLWWQWGGISRIFESPAATPEGEFTPTSPEEKMRILESLPPVENPLTAEEKRAILENLPPAQ
jgi:hypothetical protein